MTHPLTDKKLKELFWDHAVDTGWDEYDWTSDGMRAAADWQLEQVIEWLKDELDYRSDIDPNLLSDLKQAMCPQEGQ